MYEKNEDAWNIGMGCKLESCKFAGCFFSQFKF